MKAIIIDQFGGTDVFKAAEVPVRAPDRDEVLISVKASSVNPIDVKLRAGALPPLCPNFPAVLNSDFSGTVAAVGAEVRRFAVGDDVFGFYGGIAGKAGALAENIVVPQCFVSRKPHSLSHGEAAVVPLVAVTAYEAVEKRAQIPDGARALVIGGAGGVGHVIVQLLLNRGVAVSATARTPDKAILLREFGVANVLDGDAEKIGQQALDLTHGDGFDIVFDTVGGDCFLAAQAALRAGGQLISLVAAGANDTTQAYLKGARIDLINILLPVITGFGGEDRHIALEAITRLIEQDNLRIHSDVRSFGFSQIGAAHDRLESGLATGKVPLYADFA